MFARRGYNIQSLAVGSAEKKGLSRITMVCPGTRDDIEKLQRQLYKLIEVVNIDIITGFNKFEGAFIMTFIDVLVKVFTGFNTVARFYIDVAIVPLT